MDLQAKKKTLRMISYGLYILSSRANEGIAASTVTWVSQSSLNPPMIMVSLEKESHTYHAVEKSGKFVLNFLGKGQKEIAQKFFKPPQVVDGKINGLSFRLGISEGAILLDAPGFIECKMVEIVKRGDHYVVLAEVIEAGVQHELEPLALRETGWSYGG